eukprot:scaffold77498_cov35-Attheya_sp.AAC.1
MHQIGEDIVLSIVLFCSSVFDNTGSGGTAILYIVELVHSTTCAGDIEATCLAWTPDMVGQDWIWDLTSFYHVKLK